MLSAFLFHEDGTLYYLSSHYILIQNLATLLCEMRNVNKGLQFEVDDLKQKLNDANGDIKVFKYMKWNSFPVAVSQKQQIQGCHFSIIRSEGL